MCQMERILSDSCVGILRIPCIFACYQGIWVQRRVRSRLSPPAASHVRTRPAASCGVGRRLRVGARKSRDARASTGSGKYPAACPVVGEDKHSASGIICLGSLLAYRGGMGVRRFFLIIALTTTLVPGPAVRADLNYRAEITGAEDRLHVGRAAGGLEGGDGFGQAQPRNSVKGDFSEA